MGYNGKKLLLAAPSLTGKCAPNPPNNKVYPMAILSEYLRPTTVAEAAELLRSRGPGARILAGGTQVIADLSLRSKPDIESLIDISRLGLNWVRATTDQLRIGGAATLTDLLENLTTAALADGLLAAASQGEGPVNLRNAMTVGGTIAGAATDSELYAALLALGAMVVTTSDEAPVPLASLVAVRGIITEVIIPLSNQRGAHARVARTPADRPIVAALAVRDSDGTRIALCGLGMRPHLSGAAFDPYADFKGSSEYRAAMAELLTARILAQLGA